MLAAVRLCGARGELSKADEGVRLTDEQRLDWPLLSSLFSVKFVS